MAGERKMRELQSPSFDIIAKLCCFSPFKTVRGGVSNPTDYNKSGNKLALTTQSFSHFLYICQILPCLERSKRERERWQAWLLLVPLVWCSELGNWEVMGLLCFNTEGLGRGKTGNRGIQVSANHSPIMFAMNQWKFTENGKPHFGKRPKKERLIKDIKGITFWLPTIPFQA